MTPLRVVFSWDSTLTTIEGAVALAARRGVAGVDELTQQAMNGEASLRDVFLQRFQLMRPTLRDLEWLSDEYVAHLTPGAREVITALTAEGHDVYVVSAAYRAAILKAAHVLGIPAHHICAVDITFGENGGYIDYDTDNVLASDGGIETVLAEIAKAGPTVFIGDSVPDAQAAHAVDLFIGYGGVVLRPEVAALAPQYIDEPALTAVLPLIRDFSESRRVSATLLTPTLTG